MTYPATRPRTRIAALFSPNWRDRADFDQLIDELTSGAVKAASKDTHQSHALFSLVLPDAHLHIGYDVNGILPSASISEGGRLIVADAGSVPEAILDAISKWVSHGP